MWTSVLESFSASHSSFRGRYHRIRKIENLEPECSELICDMITDCVCRKALTDSPSGQLTPELTEVHPDLSAHSTENDTTSSSSASVTRPQMSAVLHVICPVLLK